MSSVLGVNAQPNVYLGVWTNWSKGQIFGSTLTMTERNGDLLIALIALFVTFVGARLWRICCFALHTIYSTDTPQDAIYHHRQAVLKNSDNAAAGIVSWFQLIKAWRKVGGRPFTRILPVSALTLALAVCFMAASLLSSRIASAMGKEVLLRGSCGVNVLGHYIAGQDRNPYVYTSPSFFTVLIPFLAQRLTSFSNYALSCYSNAKTANGCNTFVKPHLPFTSNRNATCPFSKEICRLSNDNILIDTGYLNSHFDFGMNTRASERFLYRRTTHCAPLVSEGYRSFVNLTDSGVEMKYSQYAYGPSTASKDNISYVYPVPQRSAQERWAGRRSATTTLPDYTIGYTYANVINGSSAGISRFTPIDALRRTDADVTVFFLSSNQIVSPVEINDPWYSAHKTVPGFKLNFTGWDNLTVGGYFADQDVSVLGCAKQYQICYPDAKGKPTQCSRLGGKQELYWLLTSLEQSAAQLNLTKWSIMSALTGNELDAFVQTLGAASLSSRYSLVSGVQGPLPDDQWKRDVEHWHASTMVAMQGSAVDAASGPSDPAMKSFWAPPSNDQERYICNNQKILSDAHSNFSVFGLAFTFTLGGLIIIMSYMLESPPKFLRKRHSQKSYARLEWASNGTLQLQRLAHEQLGFGTWSACTQDVPTTRHGESLALLDVTDSSHPCFMSSYPECVEGVVSQRDSKDKLGLAYVEEMKDGARGSSSPWRQSVEIPRLANVHSQSSFDDKDCITRDFKVARTDSDMSG